jgi:hypothetical protein
MPNLLDLMFHIIGVLSEKWLTKSSSNSWKRINSDKRTLKNNIRTTILTLRALEKKRKMNRKRFSSSKKLIKIPALIIQLTEEVSRDQVLSLIPSWSNKKCALTHLPKTRATLTHQRPMFKLNKERESCLLKDKNTRVSLKNMSPRRKLTTSSTTLINHRWILIQPPSLLELRTL